MPSRIANIVTELQSLYPKVNFVKGDVFVWSSSLQTITYIEEDKDESIWALIHETAHAALGHKDYQSDHQLIKMESEAWQKASQISKGLNINIDEGHIEDCLDTYRDWLSKRAKCPNCNVTSLQQNDRTYKCFNCQAVWKVPDSPLCNVVRRKLR